MCSVREHKSLWYVFRTNIYAGKPVLEPTEYYIQGKLQPIQWDECTTNQCSGSKGSIRYLLGFPDLKILFWILPLTVLQHSGQMSNILSCV
jgi:hypothetical protein